MRYREYKEEKDEKEDEEKRSSLFMQHSTKYASQSAAFNTSQRTKLKSRITEKQN